MQSVLDEAKALDKALGFPVHHTQSHVDAANLASALVSCGLPAQSLGRYLAAWDVIPPHPCRAMLEIDAIKINNFLIVFPPEEDPSIHHDWSVVEDMTFVKDFIASEEARGGSCSWGDAKQTVRSYGKNQGVIDALVDLIKRRNAEETSAALTLMVSKRGYDASRKKM